MLQMAVFFFMESAQNIEENLYFFKNVTTIVFLTLLRRFQERRYNFFPGSHKERKT